ncbi:hypothetical protein PC9H_004350 [Pleurotus ostreatus]|uniref:Translation initiation factor eIF4e n=2 Tax=Pleurotus ostreatus TaxID=5322 RepID=A0A067P0T4_PLEO1|nr:uncharacterized protein PC9H_004350 [Pleurotus ostreatus]KAF7437509.1 hypothetical protein PC9H_004350 [Pleurotus ostreatus]KDQ30022.1 hypothetical protein PLEOSDRAFT_61029 [Pleurotus ostreatus PC15]
MSSTRLPSLNQLAARINPANPTSSQSGAGQSSNQPQGQAQNRPRLAAFALRTHSNSSLATTASTTDSVAVNVPSTRAASPSNLSTSPPRSDTPTVVEPQGEPLTKEGLEKLNEETAHNNNTVTEKKKGVRVGYKNIPSLDAITARLANVKERGLSIDGSARPPEAEMIEDPKTPGLQMKAPEHPLQYTWTIYHDTKAKFPFTPASSTAGGVPSAPQSAVDPGFPHTAEPASYEANLTVIGEFDTVESFCRYFNWLKPPSALTPNSNYHLFKHGIKPMWEDPSNAQGGKWVITMRNNPALLDQCWKWLAMALIGEELEEGDDEICGAVVSLRSKVDRIQVWTRSKEDVERLNGIGKRLIKLLDVSEADGIGLEFQYNTEDRPLPNKFISIQSLPSTSFRAGFQGGGGTPTTAEHPSTPHQATSGHAHSLSQGASGGTNAQQAYGAFGSFGVGIGPGQGAPGGGNAWRPRRG